MKNNRTTLLLGAGAAVLLTAGSGWAKLQTQTIQIESPAAIPGGTLLAPGSYQVALDTTSNHPKLDFYQKRKEVAQVPVKLVSGTTKSIYTDVQYDTTSKPDVITEVDFKGSTQKILIRNPARP